MRARASFLASSLCLALSGPIGCGSGESGSSSTGSSEGGASQGGGGTGSGLAGSGAGGNVTGTGGGGNGGAPTPICTEPTDVPCEDDVVLQMDLKEDPAPGLITNAPDGVGWTTFVDAVAGGAFSITDSYTYGKFTDQGLQKVALGDEDALLSMDWDIAFRRYVVRINSGHSGPSCVQASGTPTGTTYESLSQLPATLSFHKDDYFTDSCEIKPDGSNLRGSPATALSGYWEYPGCVKMTGRVYVIQLADGRSLKFIVDAFYHAAEQQQCNDTGSVPMGNNGSGNFTLRWALLQ